jgi:ATP-binding cassette subfamily B protein RaxB
VLQDDRLFYGSIAENVALFTMDANLDEVRRCCELACVHEDIERMPMKYHTLTGDAAGGLSGGQKQRLLLARALFARPRLLILDEATSHLDVERESVVNQRIRALSITRLIIAHRPETIRSADRVVDMSRCQAGSGEPAVPPASASHDAAATVS